jgi:hypothetical protein
MLRYSRHSRRSSTGRSTGLSGVGIAATETGTMDGRKEAELFSHQGQGCLTHIWFAMEPQTRVRVYVDVAMSEGGNASVGTGMGGGHRRHLLTVRYARATVAQQACQNESHRKNGNVA